MYIFPKKEIEYIDNNLLSKLKQIKKIVNPQGSTEINSIEMDTF